jgi:hypothetical protein
VKPMEPEPYGISHLRRIYGTWWTGQQQKKHIAELIEEQRRMQATLDRQREGE